MARAIFIFVSEIGTISAWNNTVNLNNAIQVASTANAIYKGVALAFPRSGPRLYAANFHAGTVDVFDHEFHPLTLSGKFVDPDLPAGYGPFNIANIGGRLFVTFAKQDADAEDDVKGPGLGIIDVFDLNGHFRRRFASHGPLDAPWGMVVAPEGFGRFGGTLLVGNFGDGRINAFSLGSGDFRGALADSLGNPIEIEGLWGLHFGLEVSGREVARRLYFAAGIDDEAHGLFGFLAPRARFVACDDHGRARTVAFWSRQCGGRDEAFEGGDAAQRFVGGGISPDSLSALFECVSSSSRAFGPSGCFTAGCDLLTQSDDVGVRGHAARVLLAVLLDRCAGLICDGQVIACGGNNGGDDVALIAGDGDDALRGHVPGDHRPIEVGELVAMLDSSLCASDPSAQQLAALERLARCAASLGRPDREDGDGATAIVPGTLRGHLDIVPMGGNPLRLAGSLGAQFMVSTTGTRRVRVAIYDAAGRLVAEPLRDAAVSGQQVVRWDGLDQRGIPVPSGTYFYRGTSGDAMAGGRIVVMR